MDDDFESYSPDEPDMFRFVEAGMRVSCELESIGQIKAGLRQVIHFCPVLTCHGWSDHKEFIVSLRLKHLTGHARNHCLLESDEIAAWQQLLNRLNERHCSELKMKNLEYVSRHGIRLVWQAGMNWNDGPFLLYVGSKQAAILPPDFVTQMIGIFSEFESLCRRYKWSRPS